jgi:uncharacterized protein YvpB
MKKLEIPFFSQLDEEGTIEHKRSICALVCIKMMLHARNQLLSFEEIFHEAKFIGGKESAGWNHETVVRILRNHGVLAYRQEFVGHKIDIVNLEANIALHTEEFVEKGILKIKKSIDMNNPVFVSVKSGFSLNREDHMVLIIGYTAEDFIMYDPILSLNQNPKIISIEAFKDFWKRFAIFVE